MPFHHSLTRTDATIKFDLTLRLWNINENSSSCQDQSDERLFLWTYHCLQVTSFWERTSTHSFLKEKLSDKCTKIKSSGTNSLQSIRVTYLVTYSGTGTCTLIKDRILHVTPEISIYCRARESIIKIYDSLYPLSSNTHLVKVQI